VDDYVWQFDNGIVVGADGQPAKVESAVGFVSLKQVPRAKVRNGLNEFAKVVTRREAKARLTAVYEIGVN
jgi:hypothetical protein